MDIISLKGTEDKLYELVARLVMSPAVLRQNNNYPFKTTPQYTWHIALDGNTVVGFIPVKSTDTGPYIDNYYIKETNRLCWTACWNMSFHMLTNVSRPWYITGMWIIIAVMASSHARNGRNTIKW